MFQSHLLTRRFQFSLPLAHCRNPFKSQPLDPKVFGQQGLLGVPKKPHHPATSPHTPKLATRERGEVRKEVGSDTGAEDEQVLFKAQPLPKGMFERVLVRSEGQVNWFLVCCEIF